MPVPNPCTYRFVIRVPVVRTGSYPIEVIAFGGGGAGSFATLRFTVTRS